MPIDVSCPQCGAKFKVSSSQAGKKARCGKCNGRLRIPEPADRQEFTGGPVPALPDDNEESVPMAGEVDDLESVLTPMPAPVKPDRPAFGSAPKPSTPSPPTAAAKPPKPAKKPAKPQAPLPPPPPPPVQEILSLDDDATPMPPAARFLDQAPSGDPFAFSTPHAPLPAAEPRAKNLTPKEPVAKPTKEARPATEPDVPEERHSSYVRPGERKSGNILVLAGVLGTLAIAAVVVAIFVAKSRNKLVDQTKATEPTSEKKSEPPVPVEPPKTDGTDGKKEPKNDPMPPVVPPKVEPPKVEPKPSEPAPPQLAIAAGAPTFQLRPLTAKPELTENTSGVPALIEISFDKVKRIIPPETDRKADSIVVWHSGPVAGGKGEMYTVDAYSGTVGSRVGRFEFAGDAFAPKCDVSSDGTLFVAATADGKISVWNLADPKTKPMDGFDPYADKPEQKKAGLALVFLAREGNNLVTVSTAGAVHLFELMSRKLIGELVPPRGLSPGTVIGGKNVAADAGRASVVLAAGGVIYQLAARPQLPMETEIEIGGAVKRPLAIAAVGVPARIAFAFETDANQKKEIGVLFCNPKGPPAIHRWPAAAGEPTAIDWSGTEMAVIATTRGAVWIDAEAKAFRPVALAEIRGGKGQHAATDGFHWYLMTDPAMPMKSVLHSISLPPAGFLDFRAAAEKKEPLSTLQLDEKGLWR